MVEGDPWDLGSVYGIRASVSERRHFGEGDEPESKDAILIPSLLACLLDGASAITIAVAECHHEDHGEHGSAKLSRRN